MKGGLLLFDNKFLLFKIARYILVSSGNRFLSADNINYTLTVLFFEDTFNRYILLCYLQFIAYRWNINELLIHQLNIQLLMEKLFYQDYFPIVIPMVWDSFGHF